MEAQSSNQIEVNFNPTPKQHEAFMILRDRVTNILFYGGSAGGGKTFLGCSWLIINCLQYPGTRWFIGRDKLKSIYLSTFNTFTEIANGWGLKKDEAYTVNLKDGIIKFFNGSEIVLLDMHHNPTDPNFDRLGSMEFTGGFLEEVAEVARKAYEIIFSRIRYKLRNYDLIPKMLIVSNPTKNWVYTEFYNPWKNGALESYKRFLPALATDNPHLDPSYIKALEKLNEVDKQRLLYGNFDYDDDDRTLCSYDKLVDCFNNKFLIDKYCSDKDYISTDLAMQGRDKFVVMHWRGLHCRIELVKDKATGKEIEQDLERIAINKQIPRSQIVADGDGMGNYLSSYLEGIKEFRGGSSAVLKEEYKNLKAECAFKLAELINDSKIYIECNDEIRNILLEEMSQLKRDNIDKDEMKKHIIKKEEMKDSLGRSPDFLDCLIMRMYFEIQPQYEASVLTDFSF